MTRGSGAPSEDAEAGAAVEAELAGSAGLGVTREEMLMR